MRSERARKAITDRDGGGRAVPPPSIEPVLTWIDPDAAPDLAGGQSTRRVATVAATRMHLVRGGRPLPLLAAWIVTVVVGSFVALALVPVPRGGHDDHAVTPPAAVTARVRDPAEVAGTPAMPGRAHPATTVARTPLAERASGRPSWQAASGASGDVRPAVDEVRGPRTR